MQERKCSRCQNAIDRDAVRDVLLEENPPDQFDRPMESYTEYEQAFRLGYICVDCYEIEKDEYIANLGRVLQL